MPSPLSPAEPTLADIQQHLWAMLTRGAANPKDACHWPVLSTVSDHALPSACVVVLRAARPRLHELELHTDVRSRKVQHLRSNPHAALTFYRPQSRTQLRCTGRVRLHHTDAQAQAVWARLSPEQRAGYGSAAIPGSPAEPAPIAPPLSEDQAFAQFCVAVLQIEQIDWLELSRPAHRRALFVASAGTLQGQWVSP